MLNEWQEFLDYTEPVAYRASGKKDTAWLGRFTFEALRDFNGMNRILTILARGLLFHASDGTLLSSDPRERIGFAYDGLCAWCSIPERRGAPHEEWQHRTDFASLHEQFPKLVDEEGWGWFSRHFHIFLLRQLLVPVPQALIRCPLHKVVLILRHILNGFPQVPQHDFFKNNAPD